MNRDILTHQQRIDDLFTKAASITDIEIQGNWAKYLCVLVSGYVEQSLRTLLNAHTQNNSSHTIRNFVDKEVKFITNCKQNRILEVLSSFSGTWSNEYSQKIAAAERTPDENKNAIDSVVSNRHNIAHGKNVGMSIATIRGYYQHTKRAISILDEVIR